MFPSSTGLLVLIEMSSLPHNSVTWRLHETADRI